MNNLVRLLANPALLMKSRQASKLFAAFATLVAIAILSLAFRTPRVNAGPQSDRDHDQDDSKVEIGLSIAPVPLNFEHRDRRLVGLGSYIVNAQADCNGCHSAGPANEYVVPTGNPYLLSPPFSGHQNVNPATYLGGGRDFGPFGSHGELTHLYSRNLTPDKTGRAAGGLTFHQFLTVLRTGKDYDNVHPNCTGSPDGSCLLPPFNGAVLQVMPWPAHQNMTDHDILAVYEYLSAIPCIDTVVTGAPYLHNDCD